MTREQEMTVVDSAWGCIFWPILFTSSIVYLTSRPIVKMKKILQERESKNMSTRHPSRQEALKFRQSFEQDLNVGQKLQVLFDSFKEEERKLKLKTKAPSGNLIALSQEQFQTELAKLRAHFFAAIKSIDQFSHITGIILPSHNILLPHGEVAEMEINWETHVDINRLIILKEPLEPQHAIFFAFEKINLFYEMLLYTFEPEKR